MKMPILRAPKTGESYSKEYWKRWTDMGEAKALPGAIEFLEIAKNLDIEIYYISNRRTNELESTITNMKTLGFPEIRKDHFLFKEETSNKEARRDTIRKDYDVLLYLGDNLNDYSNFLGDRKANFGKDILAKNKDILGRDFIILPNPMYGNWAQALSSSIEEENPNKSLLILLENMTDFRVN
jgi:5'-nucleotidase (lipoprotein e(P4) family)